MVVGYGLDRRGDVAGRGAHPDAARDVAGDLDPAPLGRRRVAGELAQRVDGRAPGFGQPGRADHAPVALARVEDDAAAPARQRHRHQRAAQAARAVIEDTLEQLAVVRDRVPDTRSKTRRELLGFGRLGLTEAACSSRGLPDGEGEAFMVMLIGPVIGVRWLGPSTDLDGFRAHPGLGQERVEILPVVESTVEIEVIYVFLGRDLPDIRIGSLAVIHRPHIGHDKPARADHPVEFPERVPDIGQVPEQIPAKYSVDRIVEQASIEGIHSHEYGSRANPSSFSDLFRNGHGLHRGIPAEQDGRAFCEWREITPVTAGQVNYHPGGVRPVQRGSPCRVRHGRITPEVLLAFQVRRAISLVPHRDGRSVARRIAATQRDLRPSPV